jgi:hypothetical protein
MLSLFSPCPEIGVANGEFKFQLDVDHSFPGLDGETWCKEGCRAVGANPITCQLGGEWSPATCEACSENCLQCDDLYSLLGEARSEAGSTKRFRGGPVASH